MPNLEEFAENLWMIVADSQLRNPAPDPNDRDKADKRPIMGEFFGVDTDKGT